MKILLLDMDGVLLEARAYHQALREVVSGVGRALGFRQVNLTQEDIHFFESVGVTSEWDSSAICSALLLARVWEIEPAYRLPAKPPLPEPALHDLPPPDFQAFFRTLAAVRSQEVPSLVDAERLILAQATLTQDQVHSLQALLRNARQIQGSLTHRMFQELILGSRVFQEQYHQGPNTNTEGYLLTHDKPTLGEAEREKLLTWLSHPDQYAAIFTNRPSKPPGDFFDTPEAELGLKMVRLEGLPIVGHGSFVWLAPRRGLHPDDLLKPSPVHVLAALRCALGDRLELALESSASLALEGVADTGWGRLEGATVCVFEDAAKGLHSARAAYDALNRVGVSFDLQLRGVSADHNKVRSLRVAGAQVFADLPAALAPFIDPT